ncbi:MAG: hypothetical protein KDM63_06615 [Verrucomicrobiae bacterium]|nr:hypothetical protein [Verrucomicrobiae bacterium]
MSFLPFPNRHRLLVQSAMACLAIFWVGSRVGAASDDRYLAVVRRALDAILENGRDTYGEERSGMILSVLDRSTGKPMRLLPKAPNGVRQSDRTGPGGSNANLQQDLYRTMQHVSRLTGDPRYEDAVRVALSDFLRITQHPETGFLAWGEHLYWNCVADKLGDLDPNKTHEQKRKFIYFDDLYASDPDRTVKYARGLWEHQIADHETGNFSRHAKYDRHAPGRDYDFAKEGGYFIDVWSRAFAKTEDPVFAKAVQVMTRRYLGRMSDLGLIQLDSTTRPDWLNTCVTLYLVALAVECSDAVPRMDRDAESVGLLRKLAASQDQAFLSLAHAVDDPGRGFVSYAATDTGKPQPVAAKQSQGYSRHWNLGYGVHSTAMIALLCNTRQGQLGDTDQGEAYRKLVIASADLYHQVKPDPVADDLWAGEYGMVILNQIAAYRLTRNETYLTSARQYADEAIRVFWDGKKPLPRASSKTDYYDVITSPDTLMLALTALHEHVNQLDPRVEISDLIR